MLAEHLDRDAILEKLNSENIAAGMVHLPNDIYSCFQKYKTELPGVRKFANHQLSLPCGWWLNEDDAAHIAKRLIHHCSG
jgi:dTDP-4-amino-4,6-dideoxygalactose transaminase